MFEYKISVIVPVYNVETTIRDCLDSLVQQTIDKKLIEVLLINDGSTDNSLDICYEYERKYPYFKVFTKENEGLSKTRNFGIVHAKGQYIAYLDSDDMLTSDSLRSIVAFFDEHNEEIDIVTYKIVPYINGRESSNLHYRYAYLNKQGVYDLTLDNNIYISQTNINICVKNLGEANILFDSKEGFKHEDQKYNLDVVSAKMKIGYCEGAKYLYYQNSSSITHTEFYAYYMFEATMAFWEDLFGKYNHSVPKYIQAMYVNDVNWKMMSDILLPYHYQMEEGKYEAAIARIKKLLTDVDDDVIIRHPKVDVLQNTFLISKKDDAKISAATGPFGSVITNNGKVIHFESRVNLVVTNFKPFKDYVYIDAFLRSSIFDYTEKPKCYACLESENEIVNVDINLIDSQWNFYHCKVKTNKFYRVVFKWDFNKFRNVKFYLDYGDGYLKLVSIDTIKATPFCIPLKKKYFWKKECFSISDGGFSSGEYSKKQKKHDKKILHKEIYCRDKRIWLVRCFFDFIEWFICNSKKRIWLYHDCKNVYKDNGYYQFVHDFEKNDGVIRYYVVNDDIDRNELFSKEQKKRVVRFGSLKHKVLFFASEKIVTAFAEWTNFVPMYFDNWQYFSDLFSAEVVYLQHGVLHAYLPWKYSKDRLQMVDKEVVSTEFEVNNLKENYGFDDDSLIKSGMPRYDFMESEYKSEKKILFAPTWRKYLISLDKQGVFHPLNDKFIESDFFKETYAFLHSEQLQNMLKETGYVLDFKLHPIFKDYASFYNLEDLENVHLADNSVDEYSYKIFITDYSSYGFDFVYLKKTFMYFVPDIDKFYAGMNDYRKLDLPFENGFGPLSINAESAVESLKSILYHDGEPEQKYKERMEGFFLHYDKSCRDRIYEEIK